MLEWIDLSPDMVVIATVDRAMLHVPQALSADPFRRAMSGAGKPETTHWLFEGAMALAARTVRAEPKSAPRKSPRALSAALWAYRLAGYFHTTHATRRLLPAIARRFADSDRPLLAAWAEHKVSEEAGHDELALQDLAELGYRARALVAAVLPARATAWVTLFEQIASDDDPVGCVGYAHALERLALLRGATEVALIEAALPIFVHATRCLRVHSALGSDQHHVRANVAVTAALSASERRRIVQTSYAAARIYFEPALDVVFDSAQIEAELAPFRAPGAARPERLSNNQEQTDV